MRMPGLEVLDGRIGTSMIIRDTNGLQREAVYAEFEERDRDCVFVWRNSADSRKIEGLYACTSEEFSVGWPNGRIEVRYGRTHGRICLLPDASHCLPEQRAKVAEKYRKYDEMLSHLKM